MATIKLRIHVPNLTNVLTLFDQIKVYRSTTGEAGVYTEITGVGTRIPMVAGTDVYTYDDTTGDPSYWYKTSYFNSSTSAESSLSDPIQGEGTGNYTSLQEIRDEGVTVSQASDARVLLAIEQWEQYIDRVTGQWFYPRSLTIVMDGNDSDTLFLGVPIISLTSLTINSQTDALDSALYKVYNRTYPDDRWNPKLRLVRNRDQDLFQRIAASNFGSSSGLLVFEKGYMNQTLIGSFGFVEPNGTAPLAIKYVAKKLVINHLTPLGAGGSAPTAGPVVEEWTDGHKIKYASLGGGSQGDWTATGDSEVDEILARYRRPIAIATAQPWGNVVIGSA